MAYRLASRLSRRTLALLALLLAIVWVPLTSHELLEAAGLIHQDGPQGEEGPAHEAADGVYRADDGGIHLKAPTLIPAGLLLVLAEVFLGSLVMPVVAASYPRRATVSPPGLARRWHFLLRLALPSQSPSFAL